jgi:hypothetical protein
MCVRFEYTNKKISSFSPDKDVEEQILGLKSIQIDFQSDSDEQEVKTLIQNLKKFFKIHVIEPFEVKFNNNSYLAGAVLAKDLKQIQLKNTKAYIVSQSVSMHSHFVNELDSMIEDIKRK